MIIIKIYSIISKHRERNKHTRQKRTDGLDSKKFIEDKGTVRREKAQPRKI